MTKLADKIEALEGRLKNIGGCSDGNCIVWRQGGMHTNGGCKCNTDKYKMVRVVHAYHEFVAALRAREANR